MTVHIESARDDHLAEIAAIYNDAVVNTTAIWNDAQVDIDNRRVWLAQRGASGYPVLVALGDDHRVLGYASFGDFRAFDGYRFSVENSVYVHRDAYRLGIGRSLMERLVDEARALGKHLMIAAVESGNDASVRLHERLGFVVCGRMDQVGTKFGRWLDLTWMQLRLNDDVPSV